MYLLISVYRCANALANRQTNETTEQKNDYMYFSIKLTIL